MFIKVLKFLIFITPDFIVQALKRNGLLLSNYKKLLIRNGMIGSLLPWQQQREVYNLHKQLPQPTEVNSETELVLLVFQKDSSIIKLTPRILSLFGRVISVGNTPISEENKGVFTGRIEKFSDIFDLDFSCNTTLLLVNEGDVFDSALVASCSTWRSDNEAVGAYCDKEVWSEKHKEYLPLYYPDWNPDLVLSRGYINSGLILQPAMLKSLNTDFSEVKEIAHIATLLAIKCHQVGGRHLLERIPGVMLTSQIDSSGSWLNLNGLPFSYQYKEKHAQLTWPCPSEPKVSLIIPTKDAKELVEQCIVSITEKTTYRNYEIILVDNGSTDPESISYFASLEKKNTVKLLHYGGEFNYSAINNFAVAKCDGDIIGLINNDIEVISPNWLTDMVTRAIRPEIGCVGAKLLYPNGQIQHAGVVMGYGGGAGHAHKFFAKEEVGYLGRLVADSNFSAVTAACLIVDRGTFMKVGGLNESNLKVAFNDVDFCLKVQQLGKYNLLCADAVLTHHESVSRGDDVSPEKRERFLGELRYLKDNWTNLIKRDPAYNPYLTLKSENFALSKEIANGAIDYNFE